VSEEHTELPYMCTSCVGHTVSYPALPQATEK